jgi:hypothetical protein
VEISRTDSTPVKPEPPLTASALALWFPIIQIVTLLFAGGVVGLVFLFMYGDSSYSFLKAVGVGLTAALGASAVTLPMLVVARFKVAIKQDQDSSTAKTIQE